jgi:hypothetical protein
VRLEGLGQLKKANEQKHHKNKGPRDKKYTTPSKENTQSLRHIREGKKKHIQYKN